MPNWTQILGGLDGHGLITWQTFSSDELQLLTDYLKSKEPTAALLFSAQDIFDIDGSINAAIQKSKAGDPEAAEKLYGAPATAKIREKFDSRGYTTTQQIKDLWDSIPKPERVFNNTPLSTSVMDFTGPDANALVSEVTRQLAVPESRKKLISTLHDLTETQIVSVLKEVLKTTGVGQVRLEPVVRMTIQQRLQTLLNARYNGEPVIVANLRLTMAKLPTQAEQETLLQFIGAYPLYTEQGSSLEAFYTKINEYVTDPRNGLPLASQALLRWVQQDLVPGVTDPLWLNAAAALMSGTPTIAAAPVSQASATNDPLVEILAKVSDSDVARGIQRAVYKAIPDATRDQALLDKILPAVYPVDSQLAEAFPGKTAATDYNLLLELQRKAEDNANPAKRDAAASDAAKAEAEKATAQAEKLLRDYQASRQQLTFWFNFATSPEARRAAATQGITGLMEGPTGWINAQPWAKYFPGLTQMLTSSTTNALTSLGGAAMVNAEQALAAVPGAIGEWLTTGSTTGFQNIANNNIIKPVMDLGNAVMAGWGATGAPAIKFIGDTWNHFFPPAKTPEQKKLEEEQKNNPTPLFVPAPAQPGSSLASLQISNTLRDFLGVINAEATLPGAGGIASLSDPELKRVVSFPELNNQYFDNGSAIGGLPKPRIRLTPQALNGRTKAALPPFEFKLLPAAKTNLSVNRGQGDGTDMPFHSEGIKYHHIQNIANIEVPGGAPIFQSLGIQGEVIEICGAIISYGDREYNKEFNLGSYPYGTTGRNKSGGFDAKTTEVLNSTERLEYHARGAFDQAENELAALVRSGVPCTFSIEYGYIKSPIKFEVLVRKIERIQARRDKVYYRLQMERISFDTRKGANVSADADRAVGLVFRKQQEEKKASAGQAGGAGKPQEAKPGVPPSPSPPKDAPLPGGAAPAALPGGAAPAALPGADALAALPERSSELLDQGLPLGTLVKDTVQVLTPGGSVISVASSAAAGVNRLMQARGVDVARQAGVGVPDQPVTGTPAAAGAPATPVAGVKPDDKPTSKSSPKPTVAPPATTTTRHPVVEAPKAPATPAAVAVTLPYPDQGVIFRPENWTKNGSYYGDAEGRFMGDQEFAALKAEYEKRFGSNGVT